MPHATQRGNVSMAFANAQMRTIRVMIALVISILILNCLSYSLTTAETNPEMSGVSKYLKFFEKLHISTWFSPIEI